MAEVRAVQCDACDHIEVPKDGAGIPYGWLSVEIYREGNGNMEPRVYCSYACLADVAQHRATPPTATKKRKRRTRAEIEADEKAKTKLWAAQNAEPS
jgi:hypothetical protein